MKMEDRCEDAKMRRCEDVEEEDGRWKMEGGKC